MINDNLKNFHKSQKNFRYKLFFSYLVFAFLIVFSIIIIHFHYTQEGKVRKESEMAYLHSASKINYLDNFINSVITDVFSLANNSDIRSFVIHGENEGLVKRILATNFLSHFNYMQLRIIDKDGNEIVRFDRDKPYSKATEILGEFLQNKSSRDYFLDAKKTISGFIKLSSIDLNIEHGQIETPIKPVFRAYTPFYEGKEFKGMIIVNIFMEEILRNLVFSSIYDLYLVDEKGNFLIHKVNDKSWSKYLKNKINIYTEFPRDASDILSTNKAKFLYDSKIYVQPFSIQRQSLRLLFVQKQKYIDLKEEETNNMMIAISIFVFIISFPFAFILFRPLNNVYTDIEKRSRELEVLARNLETKVALEIEKNQKKENILFHQSKLAALGEMIGNIAHQWRHPITRLSLILQNMKTFRSIGKLDDKMFESSINDSISQIEFMSKTIDDFKEFYTKNEERESFKFSDSLKSALKIIGADLEHNNIEVEEPEIELTLYGSVSEFSQVILNIFANARDAFKERSVEKAKIEVKVEKDKELVTILIGDNAGGIDKELLNKIFESNFTTKGNQGTGIGLYMSKMIIEEHFGGNLSVENSEVGALFKLVLNPNNDKITKNF